VAGDARHRGDRRERTALRVPCRHAHRRRPLWLLDHRFRFRASVAAARRRLRRRVRGRAAAVGDPDAHRHRQGDPRGGEREARRRTVRHRRRACLRDDVRARNRVPRGRGVPADPDLLRQPACRECLRARCLHDCRARRHGIGAGRAHRRAFHRRRGKPVRALSRRVARADRHLPHLHSGAAGAAERPVRRARMTRLWQIALAVAALGAVPFVTQSNTVLNFLVFALLIALAGQGWNVLGGYGGQYSFGHAAFFGTGAYVTAILQVRYGVNAYAGFALGIVAGALLGAAIGALTFRSGLRGSYFALVTLAFAEVLRIIASVA